MIIDLEKFLASERPFWTELERVLERLANDPYHRPDLAAVQRFHYLYERAAADLGKLTTFASEPDTRRYLEALVARAYGEIHETRDQQHRFAPLKWFFHTFPQTFRRHARAFHFTVLITIAGCLFGGFATWLDPDSRHVTMPFGHDQIKPSERVRREEAGERDHLAGHKASFSTMLMTHNTQVSITTLALGMTWAVGTIIALFYNGVILGAICVDYLADGQGKFLAGWLLPHGSIEIPAILIAGQAGLVLGRALIGWGKRTPLRARMRAISPDLVTLISGVAVMLVWAGFIEAFFSQYHEPVLPYWVKIGFGLVEVVLLTVFLSRSGRETKMTNDE
ncbi:MAG: stage II sporulation protein M [Verrucomicrobia bacterium]|nr:stage II sporulation protein M [Verrucomicrobiota bacterium]